MRAGCRDFKCRHHAGRIPFGHFETKVIAVKKRQTLTSILDANAFGLLTFSLRQPDSVVFDNDAYAAILALCRDAYLPDAGLLSYPMTDRVFNQKLKQEYRDAASQCLRSNPVVDLQTFAEAGLLDLEVFPGEFQFLCQRHFLLTVTIESVPEQVGKTVDH